MPVALTAPRIPASAGKTNKLVLAEEATEIAVPKSFAPVKVTSPVPPVKRVAPVTVSGPPLIPTAVAVKSSPTALPTTVVPRVKAPLVTVDEKSPSVVKLPNVSALELFIVTFSKFPTPLFVRVTTPVKALEASDAKKDRPLGRIKLLTPPTLIGPVTVKSSDRVLV